jgi:two-component system sensor histidine kinase UhpB
MFNRRQALDEITREYATALRNYLLRGGEAALQQGYELGRRALGKGLGVLDMIAIHHQTLHLIAHKSARLEMRPEEISKAGEFFSETMSSFEMTHRAFGEANTALLRLNEILEEEVKRIAHALHDEAGQLLAAVHIHLDEIARGMPPGVQGSLQTVKNLLDQVESELRRLSHELRPTVLDDLGLLPALEFLADGVSKRTGLRISVKPAQNIRLPAQVEVALYRIVQEALNNISRHAQASHVRIRLKNNGNVVHCYVFDDGVGFDPTSLAQSAGGGGLGLVGMRERLQALRGDFRIESAPGRGTKLHISVPLEA